MSSVPPRQRKPLKGEAESPYSSIKIADDDKLDKSSHLPHPNQISHVSTQSQNRERTISLSVMAALTFFSFVLRYWGISWPDSVVFDEVHFGKFASYYITREYYFDVHPPLAKIILGFAGWFVGFDGDFEFENIGDPYVPNNVPYIGMRAFPAFMGSITVPVVYAIMRESGYPISIAAFSALLILADNGHVGQTRLILLDAALILFMSLSLLSYVKFYQMRYRPFSTKWWGWMCSTGFFLACTLGCKMVGLLTFVTVGLAVLVDLWNLLDIKRPNALSMERFSQHFMARVLGLIVLPAIVYLSIFWVHFAVLTNSGPGDSFMSPQFQESLKGSEMLLNSQEIRYYDTLTFRHKDTKAFLHSHPDKYPLRYDDGRISSQGQQVTAYPFNDTNNDWKIIPTKELPESGRGRVVRHNDIVQLLHVNTDTYLMTHDVASPLTSTNQEFTTCPKEDLETRVNDTHFQMQIIEGHEGEPWRTKSGWFKLQHIPTKVYMWTSTAALPEWAFKQQEVNGNKVASEKSMTWFADEIMADETGEDIRNRTAKIEPKKVVPMNFFKKFWELQTLMLQHNAGLTASHPYASDPINWPFCLTGISFWTESTDRKQVYAIGNLGAWWICVMSLSVFLGILGADQLARRRGIEPIDDPMRNRLYNNTCFFLVAWAVHYFPFYLMSRQLFIHHYLPAHLASVLVTGSVFNFVLTETINYPVSVAGPLTRLRPRLKAEVGPRGLAILAAVSLFVIWMFWFISPLTYGNPGLQADEVDRRKLVSSWSLHFAGK